jgi:hypothetical protein
LDNCPKLYKIKLENNLIDNLDNLKCLANYNIKKLNLQGNPVANTDNYREQLFDLVPSLTSIDGKDRDGNEVESTIYGGEDEEEEEDDDVDYEEGEEEGELSEEEDEGDNGDEDDEEDEDDDEQPQKKKKE